MTEETNTSVEAFEDRREMGAELKALDNRETKAHRCLVQVSRIEDRGTAKPTRRSWPEGEGGGV